MPNYRISQMVKNGGNIIDAYGIVDVVTPCGLPMRGVVGIWPDPIMFLAINCRDMQEAKKFYESLGFAEQVRVCRIDCSEICNSTLFINTLKSSLLIPIHPN